MVNPTPSNVVEDGNFLEKNKPSKKGNIKRQIYSSAVANLLQMMQGCVLPISSIILPQLQKSNEGFYFTKEQGSWFAGLYCIGYLSGSIVGGFQSEILGRRISLIFDGFVALVGLGILAISDSYPLFLIGRYLCGHSSGSGTVAIPIYTSEISHSSIRGVTGSFLILFYFFGYTLTTILGTILPWRTAISAVAICPIAAMVLLYFNHSSPTWLLRHGKEKEAMRSLLYFLDSESAVKEEKDIIIANILRENKKNESEGTFKARFKKNLERMRCPSFWKPFLILFFMLPVFCAWSMFPMIAFYMVTILEKIRVPMNPYKAASVLTVTRLFVAGFALLFISKVKRRICFFSCLVIMVIGAGILSVNDFLLTKGYLEAWGANELPLVKWIPVIGIFLLYISNSFGFAQIIHMVQGEIFPADTRALGGGILGILDGFSIFLSTKVGVAILENYGVYMYFGITCMMFCFLGVFTYIFLPETYGKHLCEIESYFLGEPNYYKNKKSKSKEIF